MKDSKRVLVALVEDKFGVLNRVVSLFRRRGINIVSSTIGPTHEYNRSRMALVVEAENVDDIEQVRKQLEKLVYVIRAQDITGDNYIARELALIHVWATPENRTKIFQIAEIFRANIVDVAPNQLIIEITGDEDTIDSFQDLMKDFHIIEMARTGRVVLTRCRDMRPLIDKRALIGRVRIVLDEFVSEYHRIQVTKQKTHNQETQYDTFRKRLKNIYERFGLIKQEFSIASKEIAPHFLASVSSISKTFEDLNTVLDIDLVAEAGKSKFDKTVAKIHTDVQNYLQQEMWIHYAEL